MYKIEVLKKSFFSSGKFNWKKLSAIVDDYSSKGYKIFQIEHTRGGMGFSKFLVIFFEKI